MAKRETNRGVIRRTEQKEPPVNLGKNYILAIAIDDYRYQPKLANAVKDTEDLLAILLNRYHFSEQHIIRLYNEAANKPQIFAALDKLTATITPQDSLLIYYAGHGYFHAANQTGHLIPQGAKPNVWEYLSNANLKDSLRAINSLHTFLIVDSCFSGSLFSQSRNVLHPIQGSIVTFAERVARLPSRWCLAAGMIEEVADGLRGENSPFSQAILAYLRTNQSAKFPASALIQHVKRVTPNNAHQTPIGGILFNMKDMGGEFVFALKNQATAIFDAGSVTNTAPITTTVSRASSSESTPVNIEKQISKTVTVPQSSVNKKWIIGTVVGLLILILAYNFWASSQQNKHINQYNYHLEEARSMEIQGLYSLAVEEYQKARNLALELGYSTNDIDAALAINAQKGPDTQIDQRLGAAKTESNDTYYESLVGQSVTICGTNFSVLPNSFKAILHQKATGQLNKYVYLQLDRYAYQNGNYQPELSGESGRQIDYLAHVLKCYPTLGATINVHLKKITQQKTTGKELQYAEKLKQVLINKGVSPNQLSTKSLFLKPIPANQVQKRVSPVSIFVSVR